MGAWHAHATGAAPEPRAAARPAPFIGILSDPYGGATRVGCFGSLSLRPRSTPFVIGEYHDAWSASPDGTRVALGISAPGKRARIGVRIVNLARGTVERALRLAAVDAAGRLRSVRLRLPRAELLGGRLRPALVADPVREQVYVLTGGRTVVEVDLRRMRVRRRRLRQEPASGEASGRVLLRGREAIWLGAGRLALTGYDVVRRQGTQPRGPRFREVPAGLSRIDIRSLKVRAIDREAGGAELAPGRLLAHGPRGVRGYTRDGRLVFDVLRPRSVWSVGSRGRLAYATTPSATHVIDTRSGRVIRRIPRSLELAGVVARRC